MTYFGDEKFALIAAIFCLGGAVWGNGKILEIDGANGQSNIGWP